MNKFKAVNKKNGRNFILNFQTDSVIAYDVEKETEKEISTKTVKRWYLVGEEIIPEIKKEKVAKKPVKENKGKDKRKKVTEEQVREIREQKNVGASISQLAKDFGLSYSGMYWIVKGNTWANLDKEVESKVYWYSYRHRGFSIGCQPKGHVKVDESHGRFGAISYDSPLTDKQKNDYELDLIKY